MRRTVKPWVNIIKSPTTKAIYYQIESPDNYSVRTVLKRTYERNGGRF